MKILFTADLHSDIEATEYFAKILYHHFDLGIIAGDLTERGTWAEEIVVRHMLRSAHKPILIVRGNHDFSPWNDGGNIHIRGILCMFL
jgi:predicted phosphodiesterase